MSIVEWGQPLTGFWSFKERKSESGEVKHGEKVEVSHDIVQNRPLTRAEFEMVVTEFVNRMRDEYPEHDVEYVAIESGSSLKMRVQLEENSPIATWTLIQIIIGVIIAAVGAIVIWGAWEIVSSAVHAIKSFGNDPLGYTLENPVKTALILSTPIVGAVVVNEVYLE